MTYDIALETWEHAKILTNRLDIATVINDGQLYCAGGVILTAPSDPNQIPDILEFDIVEIIDANTLELIDSAHLSIPRNGISAVSIGTKILFAGGENTDFYFDGDGNFMGVQSTVYKRIDIYDTATNTWSIDSLSEARSSMGHAVWGDKAYFAGGFKGGITGSEETSNRVDIYDASTDTWSTAELAQARAKIAGVASNGKIYFAGGVTETNTTSALIDVYDAATESWDELVGLSAPRASVKASATAQNVFFSGGEAFSVLPLSNIGLGPNNSPIVDIYHIPTDTWDTYEMEENRVSHVALSTDNQLFIVGGADRNSSNETIFHSTMLVFEDIINSTAQSSVPEVSIQSFPNPVQDDLFIKNNNDKTLSVSLVDILGKKWMEGELTNSTTHWNVSELPSGIYFLTKETANQERINISQKIIKK